MAIFLGNISHHLKLHPGFLLGGLATTVEPQPFGDAFNRGVETNDGAYNKRPKMGQS